MTVWSWEKQGNRRRATRSEVLRMTSLRWWSHFREIEAKGDKRTSNKVINVLNMIA